MSLAPRHTLDQLLVLEAVAETGSFGAAARRLHRVPSAVSYAVGGLEEALGVALFDRSGHRASLTPQGRRVLAAGAALLESARRLDALGQSLSGGYEPTLHIVVDGALPMGPIVEAIGRFVALGLPTRLRLDVEYQQGTVEGFVRGRADLVMALDLEEAGAVRADPLPPLEMVLVARSDHALARMTELDRASLHGHIELVVRDSSARFGEAPREPWFGTAHAVHLGDFSGKRLALLAGLGFGWMPRHLIGEELARGELRQLALLEGATWTYRPALAHRAGHPLGPAGERFRALLLERCGAA